MFAIAMASLAQGLDLQSRVMLQRRAVQKARSGETIMSKGVNPLLKGENSTDFVMGFVKIDTGYDRSDIEKAGFKVLTVRGDVAIVSLPADSATAFAKNPAVRKLSLERPVRTNMDLARTDANVNPIHNGDVSAGLDVPYTGKGVLAAIVDQGVDPNHIAFLDANGKSRVTYLTDFDGTADKDGVPNFDLYGDEIYGEDAFGNTFWYPSVSQFRTDEIGAYHGTHTLNILGGAYKGDVEVSTGMSPNSPKFETKSNPYYGVAPEVQMAVSCGSLNDACIAYGLNGLLDYAGYAKEEAGMPSVVSMSLGSTMGPHDPNGLFNYFLDLCGEESIIVLAAGNEGDLKIALKKDLKEGDNTLATMVYPYAYRYDSTKPAGQNNTYVRQGAVMIYGSDERPFKINAFVMTGEPGNYRKRATFDISSQEGDYYLSNAYYADYVGGIVNSTIGRYFDGYVGGGSMLDADLNRWYGVFDYYLYTNPETGFNSDGSEGVIVGFEVIGEDGQRIECYADGLNTWMYNYGMDAYMDGMTDGTISDMAVGHNNITVGAYTTRTEWTSLDGKPYWYDEKDGFVIGDIGHYTSYGTLMDGRTLPHVCAPGSAVISAMSTPYVEDYFKGYEQYIPMNFQARTTANGKTYYWKQETGTSMATPFVAGAIALWLEADPTLTVSEVRDIINKTARRDEYVEKGIPAQWGAGKFDALAGLKEVISRAGVQGVTVDSHNNRLILTPVGDRLYNFFVGDAAMLDIKIYNLSGVNVFATVAKGSDATIDLSSLPSGIYVAKVGNHSKKFVIR